MLKYFKPRPMKERLECKMQNFVSSLIVLLIFENFQIYSLGIIASLKMSLEGTIGRLRSELCSWGVKLPRFPLQLFIETH